jgi:hypothetical protein
MFIPDHGSNKNNKKEGGKLVVLAFFVAINLKKFKVFYYLASTEKNLSHSTKNLKKEGGKLVVLAFFVAINMKKLKIILLFNKYRKKSEPFDKEFKFFFTQKITELSEICVWDPGYGKNLSRIPG